MGLFNLFTKSSEEFPPLAGPYEDRSTNFIYHLLFCDDIDLYKSNTQTPYTYPFDVLFSETSTNSDLEAVINDTSVETRAKILAYNRKLAIDYPASNKELLAVIVEVGLEDGLDTLASFNDGTARYINQSGKILIWEAADTRSTELTQDLFAKSENIISHIGPWDKPRRPAPSKGNLRITFLVSDGLYFGEGPINTLFNDQMAGPALLSATYLMKYLTEKSLATTEQQTL